MFDAYRNHVSEGLEVNILVTGFKRLDHGRTLYKVIFSFLQTLVYWDKYFALLVVLEQTYR